GQDLGRIAGAKERLADLAQPLDADHLAVEVRHGPDGHWPELLLDDRQVLLLDLAQPPEIAVDIRRQDAVRDDEVARIAEEVEVRERALRFGDRQLLEGKDHPYRCRLRVSEELVES